MSTTSRLPEAKYFQPNPELLPVGPARIAESSEARKRRQVAQHAVNASRDLKDALVVCQQLDRTGNFDGGFDHALQVWDRVNRTMERFRVAGITFLADFDSEDAA